MHERAKRQGVQVRKIDIGGRALRRCKGRKECVIVVITRCINVAVCDVCLIVNRELLQGFAPRKREDESDHVLRDSECKVGEGTPELRYETEMEVKMVVVPFCGAQTR